MPFLPKQYSKRDLRVPMDLRHRETSAQRRTVVDEARFREYLADVTSEGLIARCQALSDPLRTLHRRIVRPFR